MGDFLSGPGEREALASHALNFLTEEGGAATHLLFNPVEIRCIGQSRNPSRLEPICVEKSRESATLG